MNAPEKKTVLADMKAALTIAERLYKTDPKKYKETFGWIGRQAKLQKPSALVLKTLQSLDDKAKSGGPAGEVIEYLGGTLRKLEQESAGGKAHDAMRLGEIMDLAGRAKKQ